MTEQKRDKKVASHMESGNSDSTHERTGNSTRTESLKGLGLAAVFTLSIAAEQNDIDPNQLIGKGLDYLRSASQVLDAAQIAASSYGTYPDIGGFMDIGGDYIASVIQIYEDHKNGASCKITSQSTRKQVGLLLETENKPLSLQTSTTETIGPSSRHDYAKEQAEKNGLTLVDEKNSLKQIDDVQTLDEVLEIVNNYTKYHSLKITIPDTDDLEDFPLKYFGVRKDELTISRIKSYLKDLLQNLYYIPTELTSSADVKEIKIVGSIYHIMLNHLSSSSGFVKELKKDKNKTFSTGGYYNPVNKNIYVGLNSLSNKSLSRRIRHELSHALLFKYCGIYGALNDEEFSSINPDGFSYSDINSRKKYKDLSSSRYGYENVYEDAAYIMGDLILSFPTGFLDSLPPVQREKLELDITRLEAIVPGFAEYWRSLVMLGATPQPKEILASK